jgi:Glucose inhibited division protein A
MMHTAPPQLQHCSPAHMWSLEAAQSGHSVPMVCIILQDNLAETPVYGGWVDSTGPRYCPSIEDKIVRFRDKDSHQVQRSEVMLGFMLTPMCY